MEGYKENTTQSPGMIIKLNILQKRDNVMAAIESYYMKGSKKRSGKARVRSCVQILFLELRPMLIRYKDYDPEKLKEKSKCIPLGIKRFNELSTLISSDDVEDCIKAFQIIDVILDRKKLILWDNHRLVDSMDLEANNRANHI